MTRIFDIRNFTNGIKLFTYISATVLLIVNNNFQNLTRIIPIIVFIFFTNYSRDYFIVSKNKAIGYVITSMAIEMILILSISFFDKENINLLLFFVFVSSTVIIHPFIYSIFLVAVYLGSTFFIFIIQSGFTQAMQSFLAMFFNYGVSIAFVVGMSYLVKVQIREKEKLARTKAELEKTYKKLIETSAIAEELTVEKERTRMAREIHDTLAHTLTTLIIQLEACKKLSSKDPSRLPMELEKAQKLSRSGFNEVKRSIKALRPQVMEEKSFFASINAIINETMENTKVKIVLNNLLPKNIKLASQHEVALFRITQESITNSIRHGQASEIEIYMEKQENDINLRISDNGYGCANMKKGYGTQGIQERVESLKGTVEFESFQGKGFKTKVLIPCEVL
ncbi:sensor histidine kinase [Clostridium sp.]|uniref:sensor histidine kinase n=1 Tax=Clostridium sp. TaxID=1506 RepID=UPI002FC7FF6A